MLWTFSIVAGSRSWICFFLPLLKGQGNMKPQKANSSLCHISVSPQGNIAVVFLMLFFPPPTFQSTVLGTTGDSSHTYSHIIPSKLLLMNIGSTRKGPSHCSTRVMSRGKISQGLASSQVFWFWCCMPTIHSIRHTHKLGYR